MARLAASDDFHDLQPVAGIELALLKFRRSDRLTIVLDDHAARQQTLRDEEFLD